jgi:hypothetical protein
MTEVWKTSGMGRVVVRVGLVRQLICLFGIRVEKKVFLTPEKTVKKPGEHGGIYSHGRCNHH